MTSTWPTVFLWNDSRQDKTIVAATATSDCVQVYYALKNRCLRGSSCTVASHIWYGAAQQYAVEEFAREIDC